MTFTHSRIVLPPPTLDGSAHSDLFDRLERASGEAWYVPYGPLTLTEHIDWRITSRDKYVHIPVIPYLLDADPGNAMTFMFQLGMRCVINELPSRPRRVHTTIGLPVEHVAQQGIDRLRIYAGIAICL